MFEREITTSDRILTAALQLMQAKGFKSVTTKDIAVASEVSEMTVFRQFKSKKGVLEAAIIKYAYIPSFKKVFEEQVKHELEHDLKLIAKSYLDLMEKNREIFLIAIQERTTMPELIHLIADHTKQMQRLITDYFETMQDQNKMAITDASQQAMVFLTLFYGYFSSHALWGNQFISETKEEFIERSMRAFCHGLST